MAEEPRVYANTVCPYCSVELDPLPKAKKKCPACWQPIYVRSAPDGLRYLLQEADLPVLEAAWAEKRLQESYVSKAAEAGFDLHQVEAELRAKNPNYTARDAYWSGMNHAVIAALKRPDWQAAQMLYFQMALMALEESDEDLVPERALRLQLESDRAALMYLLELDEVRRYGVLDTRVEIIGCDCTVCRSGPHKRLWARDELAAPHIPHKGCDRDGWCACGYVLAL